MTGIDKLYKCRDAILFQLIASRHILWCIKNCKLRNPPFVKAGVPLAFVAAVGGVGLEDVAVATLQLFQDSGLVDHAGAAVVGECAEKN